MMRCEITSRDTLDPTIIAGDFTKFLNDLNVAAVAGKQFVIATEVRADGEQAPVGLETRNITRIRPIDGYDDAFVGR